MRALSPLHSTASLTRRVRSPCPATRTCSRPCRVRSHCGPAVSRQKSATTSTGLRHAQRRIVEESAGVCRGLWHAEPARSIAKARAAGLEFAENHEPVTAVQLSRGKGEAEVLFQVTMLMQDLGRLASDLLLFYTREFGFVELPDAFTTGSSIMPQKRNPDVFELVRGRSATAQACLVEVLGITAKLPSGLPARPAVDQGATVPLDRPVPRVARHHGGRDPADSLPAGAHPHGSRHPRRGRGERTRRDAGYSVSRGLSPDRREIPRRKISER